MSILFHVIAHTTVVLLGMNATAQSGPPSNDDCSTPMVLPGTGLFAYDTNVATTGAEGQIIASSGCGSSPLVQDLWYTFTPTTTGNVTITTCGLFAGPTYQTSRMRVYTGAGCPAAGAGVVCHTNQCSGSDGSYITYGFPCWEPITIQLGNEVNHPTLAASGNLSISQDGSPCPTPTTSFCGSNPFGGTCLGCGNNGSPGRGCANALFANGANLTSYGVASIWLDTFSLLAAEITGPGLFFQSNGLLPSAATFGDGMLCAGIGVVRLGVVIPAPFQAAYPGGTGTPIHVAGAPIAAGDTRHYQCWYRDAAGFCTAATFNLTSGVRVTWLP